MGMPGHHHAARGRFAGDRSCGLFGVAIYPRRSASRWPWMSPSRPRPAPRQPRGRRGLATRLVRSRRGATAPTMPVRAAQRIDRSGRSAGAGTTPVLPRFRLALTSPKFGSLSSSRVPPTIGDRATECVDQAAATARARSWIGRRRVGMRIVCRRFHRARPWQTPDTIRGPRLRRDPQIPSTAERATVPPIRHRRARDRRNSRRVRPLRTRARRRTARPGS